MGGRGVDARMRLAARHDVEHEPVELGLAQRIRSFPFNRILDGEARAFSRAGVRHAFAVLAARQFRGDLRLLPVARL